MQIKKYEEVIFELECDSWLELIKGALKAKISLYGANLRSANLRSADLRSANLYGADLYGANLRSANLYGVDRNGDTIGIPENINLLNLNEFIGEIEYQTR
jgi:uncharacterized protein YjbI with pentapeptide repeats